MELKSNNQDAIKVLKCSFNLRAFTKNVAFTILELQPFSAKYLKHQGLKRILTINWEEAKYPDVIKFFITSRQIKLTKNMELISDIALTFGANNQNSKEIMKKKQPHTYKSDWKKPQVTTKVKSASWLRKHP